MKVGSARSTALLLAVLVPAAARAAEESWPLRLEMLLSRDGGLGTLAGIVSYDRDGPWSLGAAVGVSDAQPGQAHLHLGLLGRLRLLGDGPLTLGLAVAGSHADRERRLVSQRPDGRLLEIATWRWQPGWRLDAGLEAGLEAGSWLVRLGGGVGLLNRPRLDYEGPCGGARGPTCQDYTGVFGTPPGQVAPYASVSAAWRIGEGYLAENAGREAEGPLPDPRGDGALLAPAALTVPEGSFTLKFRQLAIVPYLQLDYGLTDRVQLAGGLGVALPDGPPLFVALAKARLVDWGRLHVGLMGGYLAVVGRYFDWQVAGLGPVASVCFDSACASFASLSILPGVLFADPDDGLPYREYGALGSGSVVYAVTRRLKLIAELHLSPEEPAWIAALRITLGRLGIDVGVVNLIPLGSLTMRL